MNIGKAILERSIDLVIEQTNNRQDKNYGDLWNNRKIYSIESFISSYDAI